MLKLDILVLSVHPDDAELGCSGTILKHIALGYKVGIVDLTRGELGTRGSAEIRKQEAAAAAEILGLAIRENLGLPDAFFENTREHQVKVIEAIRKFRPSIVITNAYHDRHPDHGRANELVEASAFLAGLRKIETFDIDGTPQEAWRPDMVLHFIQDNYITPDILIDVTEHWDKKIESINAYGSQFYNPSWEDEPQTYISTSNFIEIVTGRAREFGKSIQVKYAEGFTSRKILGVDNLFNLK
ncbi:bacillithiol biosynthesis deacetylase BshB1 [Mucilaginibacter rubeus]|uniref:Bacillithiol biosynthesis deacetylase BshB1 n=2 Tax=Mucilaginibacter TaxID=423349 RepID=A0AAE6MG89_9SPHI|nr:bacillithiol biosynthesis deacetylase BshB1 [Mucilaginibacter rubeus]QEM02208.1 bacillithiol biosynthesis deacetylase BshB1 [Mucilaginibacter rubeus]QTE42455.1 bacillithiol biosynthesis deacetylase BshB1 [Mucilaginibacter rubeus]QTE49058.1 bacillithiol biosynthesis deacetylase BshB1 [Mucilaginibacter rubeus]QTE54156.1 bacillithiol biosynthesis deacetylase BshB1 [Mucilaginibacter rubeus]QTE66391.1 bacillithiol biosynthesis deacetylase BshB1 [Mucilaginibacter rubeus]